MYSDELTIKITISSDTIGTFEDVNPIKQSIADTADLFQRSNEPQNSLLASSGKEAKTLASSVPEVEANLQQDYDFHGFNKESEDKDEDDYHDEDDELLYGDIKGTNETMGGEITTNHTTQSHASSFDSHGAVKNPGVVNENVPGNSGVHGNFNQIPESEPGMPSEGSTSQDNSGVQSTGHKFSNSEHSSRENGQHVNEDNRDSTGQQTDSQQGVDVNEPNTDRQQNTGPVFRNSEHSSRENGQHVNEDNRDSTGQQTDSQQGVDVNEPNTDRQQNTGPVFRNSEQSESSQPVATNVNENNTNQGEGSNLNERADRTEENNENSMIQTSSENPTQGNNVPSIQVNEDTAGQTNSENEQSQVLPTEENSNVNINNQNTEGSYNNEKDYSSLTETHTQRNVNLDNNPNPDGNLIHQTLPENVPNEGVKQEEHDSVESTIQPHIENSNQDNNLQTISNFKQRPDSPLEVTGIPEYITTQQDKQQSRTTHAWGGDTVRNNGRSEENNQGKCSLRSMQHLRNIKHFPC